MRIRWTLPADDLEEIWNHLKQRLPGHAESMLWTIYQRIRTLKATPGLGRPRHLPGTCELVLAPPLPYVVVYSVTDEAVLILHIHHGAQNWR